VRLSIEGGAVTLHVNDALKLSRTYSGSLTDGDLGLGTWNAFAHFDDVEIHSMVSGTTVSATNSPSADGSFAPTSSFTDSVFRTIGVASQADSRPSRSAAPSVDSALDAKSLFLPALDHRREPAPIRAALVDQIFADPVTPGAHIRHQSMPPWLRIADETGL
jgi:hypothetical protein